MTKPYSIKSVFYLFIALIYCQCTNISTTKDCLLGKWIRIDTTPGRLTYEHWAKVNDSNYIGHGFVMQKKDTIWQEKMQLHKQHTNWYLDITTPENKNIVRFTLSKQTSNRLVFENELNDFPKKIIYWKANNKLFAIVADDKRKINFEFDKVK